MNVVAFIAYGLICYFVGFFIGYNTKKSKCTMGELRIDTSNEDGPYLFLEMDKDFNTLMGKEYVIFKVNLKNYISQE